MQDEGFDVELGARIREFRRDHRCTADQLAAMARRHGLGWSRSTVSKIEAGSRPVLARELRDLLGVLHEIADDDDRFRLWVEQSGPGVPLAELTLDALLPERSEVVASLSAVTDGESTADSLYTEAEHRAARQLGMDVDQLSNLAMCLWAPHGFVEERERRVSRMGVDPDSPRSLQAARGHVTRKLLAEIEAEHRRQAEQ